MLAWEAEHELLERFVASLDPALWSESPYPVTGVRVRQFWLCPLDHEHEHDVKSEAIQCVFLAAGQFGEFNERRWARVMRRWAGKHLGGR